MGPMRLRLKPSIIILDPEYEWIQPGYVYDAEFSAKMTSPRRVILKHPERPGVFAELPLRSVDILGDDRAKSDT